MTIVFSWQSCVNATLLHVLLKAKLACYFRYILISYFCILIPYAEIPFLGVHSGRSYRSSWSRSTSASLALVIDFDYCNIEWFALKMN